MTAHRLDPADVEAIARRVVEMLRDGAPHADGQPSGRALTGAAPDADPRTLTARQVANLYGVSPDWVRRQRHRLGVVQLGEAGAGRRPRLRFDAAAVERALTASRPEEESPRAADSAPAPRRRRPRARPPATPVDLVPVDWFTSAPSTRDRPGAAATARGTAPRSQP